MQRRKRRDGRDNGAEGGDRRIESEYGERRNQMDGSREDDNGGRING